MGRLCLGITALLLACALFSHPAQGMKMVATIGQVSGGSCGYLGYPPPDVLVTGFSEAIYLNGYMCGSCFKVQCIGSNACIPKRYINVMVTSICQSVNTTDVCNTGNKALNLDPRAWDLIVKTRAMGSVPVELYSVACPPPAGGVQFNVTVAGQYYMQMLIQNVGGFGRLIGVQASANGVRWFPMYRNYGSVWALQRVNLYGRAVWIKLIDLRGKVLVIPNALPADWAQGNYAATLNYKK